MRRLLHLTAAILLWAGLGMSGAMADPGFDKWVRDFWPVARDAGISRATYDAAFRNAAFDPEVLEKARYQPEFVRPLWSYLGSAVSDKRIEDGRRMLAEHRPLLDAIEARYGVDRHVLVAIWGMESSYGAVLDDPKVMKDAVSALATLAYADPRRAKFGRSQLIAILKILERGDVDVAGLKSSWAGAMGHTQFIPTTYLELGVDFDGDGRRNIWTSLPDALASSANLLAKAGWQGGKTWGYEVVLPQNFDYRIADKEETRTLADWAALGLRRPDGQGFPRPGDNGVLIAPAGARGPAFLLLRNHFVIKRYNPATAYAIGVGHLADRLRGGGPFVQSWPQEDRILTEAEKAELQQLLARSGHYGGTIDGKLGPQSLAAIRAFQAQRGMPADGFASAALLQALREG